MTAEVSGWHIRRMRPEDVEPVARLRHATFFAGGGRSIEEDATGLRDLLGRGGIEAALVAATGYGPVGSCLLVARELDQRHDVTPWLARLVVDPGYRSLGIGAALVRDIETEARKAGFHALHLYTDEAEPFYARFGWTAVDRFTVDGGPSVLMRRTLVG